MTVRLAKAHLKKKKKGLREEKRSVLSMPRERSKGMPLTATIYGARRSARSSTNDGQRHRPKGALSYGFQLFCFRVYHKINGNDLSICQNLWFSFLFFFFSFFFFSISSVYTMSEPCRHHVKKKKGQGVRQVLLVSMFDMCRTPICRQKWYVSAT